ncbi:MAG: DEAD/DEAH box helicase [Alishewanella agri]|nr:DEAD/DEAH box helicase [Alishewanella agri]
MKLRTYQDDAIFALWQFIAQTTITRGLVVLPTASGKTIIFAEFIRQLLEAKPSFKVLILGHTQEIVEQNAVKLKSIWPDAPVGIFCAGLKQYDICQVTSASRDSIIGEIGEYPYWDLVIVDEAHLIPPAETARYQQILDTIKLHAGCYKLLGFTATPFRTKTGHIYGNGPAALFSQVLYHKRIEQLVNSGYLCPLRAVNTADNAIADTRSVRYNKDDFIKKELDQVTDIDNLVQNIVTDWLAKTSARLPTVFFASSVAQACMFEQHLRECGFNFPLITAQTAKADRALWLSQFDNGEINGLINVSTLTTGWDCPRMACIVLARPTRSPGLFLQIVGRGLRLHSSKTETMLLDYGENLKRFGPIGRVRPAGEAVDPRQQSEKISICPCCDTLVSVYQLECPHCTEVLHQDDSAFASCLTCSAYNDIYAKACEVCGEETNELAGFL